MAAVVSHAMRRFPPNPPDFYSPYALRGESSHQSWPEFENSEGALARSMRYANPWLYGSVRAPSGGVLLAPAFVLCVCSDYLNGTKSSKKGPSVCKKCKGTRVPLSPGDLKFGTVRCYPTTAASSTPIRAGTVRVSSTSRPSILPNGDPYDLMRKSRLSQPDTTSQFRARSSSPSKTRTADDRSYSRLKLTNGDASPPATPGRRSILECSINPYELIASETDAGIKFVNGQRVRVAPPAAEYEDVQPKPKLGEKETDCNRFKSILKKPTTTFSDTDSHSGRERSPSPTARSGSHFYLPMPGTAPRKKVQFLVENRPKGKKEVKVEYENVESRAKGKKEVRVDYENVEERPKSKKDVAAGEYEDVEVVQEVAGSKEEEVKDDSEKKTFSNLRRSISERTQQDLPKVVFHDTMALRSRIPRKDTRITFAKQTPDISNVPIKRPETPQKVKENGLEPPKLDTVVPEVGVEELALPEEITEPVVEVEDKHTEELDEPKVILKTSSEDSPPLAPPRKRSNGKPPTQPHVVKTEPEVAPNKTVVTVTAPKAIHKIQIKNDFVDVENPQSIAIFSNPQRKTSILINGDDCYSTVNVSDDVPLYQSSVVVKDTQDFIPVVSKKSSTIYITGNFTAVPQLVPHETKVSVNTELVPSPTKSSDETLEKILKDPVEAVRRNLIPHVCGKSDVKWRQNLITAKKENSCKSLIDAGSAKFLEESLLQLGNFNTTHDEDVSSEHSSSTQYELLDPGSDCYTDTSNRSSVTEEELGNRTKFYELLADCAVELAENEDHHYESIKNNSDPIYEEIEIPPPLPSNPPPSNLVDDLHLDKEFTTRSIFEGASKYDILSYLVDAKERGIVPEDSFTYNLPTSPVITEVSKPCVEQYSRESHVSDSSEESSLILANVVDDKSQKAAEVERNDSGVGSETSKSSLSKYRTKPETFTTCEDCETSLDVQSENEPLICRKCLKKRSERKEIITEIVETEEKYSRDLQIILEEFYQPMLVAGLLTPEQLSAIFLNVEELLENSQVLAEKLRDAVEIAVDQGDEDLLTVNIGKLFLEAAPMLHAFESYCVRQGPASLLLASLEKDKELLRIFLRVSQMENALLRRMNLNSFLMVPVQRVTKYPLLLARLYKVTPGHHETREQLKEAQNKIELHLSHMNSETKDVPSKLWRRISNNSGRRSSAEMDLVNIKLRKIAVDVLEWNHDEAKFTLEGRLLYTQPTDNNWRKGRTIKLSSINALLVTNGKVPTQNNRSEREENGLIFSKHSSIREAALLLVRDKNGRYSLLREPLYLDRCIIAADPAWQSYFEVQELLGKDTFIFKAEDDELTRTWYRQLQYHAQGLGTWRKRRNALANIMINGMGLRS